MWLTSLSSGTKEFGIGVGTIILAVYVVLLAGDTGHVTCCVTWWAASIMMLSKSPACASAYACVSGLNGRHQLFGVVQPDFGDDSQRGYVRLCSMGIISDLRIF